MAQVSLASVDQLQGTLGGLLTVQEELAAACGELARDLEAQTAGAEEVRQTSERLLDETIRLEMVQTEVVERARDGLAVAEANVAAAESALSSCEAQDDDEDGDPPDCSSEAHAVSSAHAGADRAAAVLDVETRALEEACEHRLRMQQRLELAGQALMEARAMHERLEGGTRQHLRSVFALAEEAQRRFKQAQTALDEYLNANPPAAQFAAWQRWTPPSGVVVTPDVLSRRVNLDAFALKSFVQDRAARDVAFRARLADYGTRLRQCRGAVERQVLQTQIRKNLAGDVAERLVVEAFRPLATTVRTQVRHDMDDGRYTKIDLVLEGLRVPVILGRGERKYAGLGENVAAEIKCGQSGYLYSEKEHMVFQAGGHRAAPASLVICSRDIQDLSEEQEAELREALHAAGSAIVGMLPRKDEIDKACWEAVCQAAGELE